MSSLGATGLSSWKEGANDFKSGELSHVEINNGAVNLEMNRSFLDNWTKMNEGPPQTSPSYPLAFDMVYDSKTGVFIKHDFDIWSGSPQKTWTYDLINNQWTELNATIPFHGYYSMAYDSKDDVVILYAIEGTWAYNLTKDCWTAMAPQPHPNLRFGVSIAYDSMNDAIVLFGGGSNETWTYRFPNNTWTRMYPSLSPPNMMINDMVFDKATGEFVVYPGTGNALWTYNLTVNTWTKRIPAISPPARSGYFYSMAYDESLNEVVLFGGADNEQYYSDTWWYNASTNTWANKTSIVGPNSRAYQAMAYDSRNNVTVMVGGFNDTALFNDTWAYDAAGNSWSNKIHCLMPQGRYGHTMTGDGNLGVVVMFGGAQSNDVWLFDVGRNEWTNRQPSPSPPGRNSHAMVYDSKDGIFILFGGWSSTDYRFLNDTWSYDARTDTWTNLSPPDSPTGRYGHSMAYDPIYDAVVLFGGNDSKHDLGDTWIYNRSSNLWVNKNPTPAPSPDGYSQMAYDKANGLIVLAPCFDTSMWVYNAGNDTWTKRKTVAALGMAAGSTMIYDEKMGVLIFGTYPGHLFAYNMSTEILSGFDSPMYECVGYAMAYDKTSETIVYFGGLDEQGPGCPPYYDIVWVYGLQQYYNTGIFTSRPFDTGGSAYFGTLGWNATVPKGTGVGFQLKTAMTLELLNSTPFNGPDGTADSYYPVSNQTINGKHNGTRWIQYRAYLNTSYPAITPVLENVTIEYNLMQSLQIEAPKGVENWTSTHNITWSSHDPDNDPLNFDIYLDNGPAVTLLAGNLSNDTREWQWDTNYIPNGTYRVRIVSRDDNPSIPLTVNATSANFTIFHPPPPNHPPHVSLISPSNNSIVNTTTVHFSWTGFDMDGDPLTYTCRYSTGSQMQGATRINLTDQFLDLTNLSDNTTYYWTVSASDGKANGTDIPTEIWSFTVKLPPANIPVRFTSTPSIIAWVGKEYTYNMTSIDEDGDIPSYALISAPSNIILDSSTGKLRWTPSSTDIGNHTITIQVSDGRGSTDNQTFTMTVKEFPPPPVIPPKCAITYPANGTKVKGTIQIHGIASNGSIPLSAVIIRMDNGTWSTAIGLETWSFTINTAKLAKGNHRIEAKAIAANLSSETASVALIVNNPSPGTSIGGNQWCLPSIVIVLIAGIAVVVLLKKRNRL
jgi:hypothetical protein